MKGSLKVFGVTVLSGEITFPDRTEPVVQLLDDAANKGVKWFSNKWFGRMIK